MGDRRNNNINIKMTRKIKNNKIPIITIDKWNDKLDKKILKIMIKDGYKLFIDGVITRIFIRSDLK